MRELWKYFDNINRDINIDECGIQQFNPHQNYNYIVYQNFVLHYIESGKGIYEVNGEKHQLSAGEGFIIRKGVEVSYTGDPFIPWKNYWVALSGDHLTKYLKETKLWENDILTYEKNSNCISLIKEICEATLNDQDNSLSELWYLKNAYDLLDNLNKEFKTNTALKYHNTENQNYAKIAFEYMSNNYMYPITIQEVADFIGISRSYLYRQFKNEYDVSPQFFLIDYRMNYAGQLLIEQDDKIYIIAEKVGYYDQLQFSKAFKKHHGLSPRAYRKRHQKFIVE